MRLWLNLIESRMAANEIVFAEDVPGSPRQAVLESCPAYVGLGFGDVLEYRYDDGGDGSEDADEEDGIPTATGVVRRAPRRSFMFAVDGKDNITDEIAGALGQQCLNAGGDGEGTMPGVGIVCVPESHSTTDVQAWSWLRAQDDAAREQLSRKARSALDKGKASVEWFVTSVPEMGTASVPGLRTGDEAPQEASLAAVGLEAQRLWDIGETGPALDLLQRSAVALNPVSLAQFMVYCAAAGQWGRAAALAFWAAQDDLWGMEDSPDHMPVSDEEWAHALELHAVVQALAELVYFCLEHPDLEPELLALTGQLALPGLALDLDARPALRRGAELGSADALGTCLWLAVMSGDTGDALALFEGFRPVSVPLPQRLANVSGAGSEGWQMVVAALREMEAMAASADRDGWGNAQSNAGLAYAMAGEDKRALELWHGAEGHTDARLWPAVLTAFRGDVAAGREMAGKLQWSRSDWDSALTELDGQCGPWFADWRNAARQVAGREAEVPQPASPIGAPAELVLTGDGWGDDYEDYLLWRRSDGGVDHYIVEAATSAHDVVAWWRVEDSDPAADRTHSGLGVPDGYEGEGVPYSQVRVVAVAADGARSAPSDWVDVRGAEPAPYIDVHVVSGEQFVQEGAHVGARSSFEQKCSVLGDLWLHYREEATENEAWADFFTVNDVALPLAYMLAYDIAVPSGDGRAKEFIDETWVTFCEYIQIEPEGTYESLEAAFDASPRPPLDDDD